MNQRLTITMFKFVSTVSFSKQDPCIINVKIYCIVYLQPYLFKRYCKLIYYLLMKAAEVDQKLQNVSIYPLNSDSKQREIEIKSSILLGVCATVKKMQSRPMREILGRIQCKEIKILLMGGCLQTSQDNWPHVDALICFYSKGFPYLKAWRYIEKHRPFLINNYEKQQLLWDRSVVYTILSKLSIPTPEFFLLCRDPDQIDQIQKEAFGQLTSYRDLCKSYNNYSSQCSTKQLNSMRSICDRNKSMKTLNLFNSKTQHNLVQKHDHSNQRVNSKQENKPYPNTLKKIFKSIHGNQHQIPIIQQNEDEIIIKTQKKSYKFKKPFVQKPFDALNHFIRIYYPENMGGGSKLLFDKQQNESSKFESTQNLIRKEGNYIYQNFIPQNGFIIKVYTVGINYMYAQARKSPALDGIVIRNKQGKQVRYPIILTTQQKIFCKKIVLEFEQQVCGIQLLRSQQGKSYVLSVNGWSLAKNNPKYWNDCANIIMKKLFCHFFPSNVAQLQLKNDHNKQIQNNYRPPINQKDIQAEQLRSIVIVCRHADRSPKEKLKFKTKQKKIIQLFIGYFPDVKEIKYRDSKNLKHMLDLTNEILKTISNQSPEAKQFLQMKKALESGGQFEGLTHKIQFKVSDIDQKGQIKKVAIVLKWGGQLSFTGYEDAIQLGKWIRNERYKGHDLLNLYSSYQHDLKTYSSDEGRCIKTAAAFLKGLLNLEGELPPIITSMVTIDQKAQKLLDCTYEQAHTALLEEIQQNLISILNSEQNLSQSFLKYCQKQEISDALMKILDQIGSPKTKLQILYKLMKELVISIQNIEKTVWETDLLYEKVGSHQSLQDENKCEDILLIKERWNKLVQDFYDKDTKLFNIAILPQIYDTAKHDKRKNRVVFNLIDAKLRYELKKISKKLAYFIVPNEVGLTHEQKIKNAKSICTPLLQKILEDMSFWKIKSPQEQFWRYKTSEQDNWRHLRTRMYFTSASHLYSLLHLLTLGNNRQLLNQSQNSERKKIEDILYMGYLSHIQFKEYENLTLPEDSYCRFRIEISISYQFHKGKPIQEFKLGGNKFYFEEFKQFFQTHIKDYQKNQQVIRANVSNQVKCCK